MGMSDAGAGRRGPRAYLRIARVGATAKVGLRSIPVINTIGWTEDEKRAYHLADNQLAARASWHPEQLSEELRDLKLGEFDLGLIAFEPDQVEEFLGDLGLSGRTDPGGVPEVPNQPAGSSPGAQ